MAMVVPPPGGKPPQCPQCGSANTMIVKIRNWDVGYCVCLACEHDWPRTRAGNGDSPEPAA